MWFGSHEVHEIFVVGVVAVVDVVAVPEADLRALWDSTHMACCLLAPERSLWS